LVLVFAVPATSKVPTVSQVLERTAGWAASLSKRDVPYRVELDGKSVEPTRLVAATRAFDSKMAALSGEPVALWSALARGEGLAALQQRRVDTDLTRLFHLHRRVVVVVGTLPRGHAGVEVWLDRKTGAVARIVRAGADGRAETLTLAGEYPPRLVWTSPTGQRVFAEPELGRAVK